MTEAQWRAAIRERDLYCQAQKHDPRCRLEGHHCHHICYKSMIVKAAYWLVDNGILLSTVCHDYAHRTKNWNISTERKNIAVDAVNSVVPENKPELLLPYFREAA